MNMKYIFELKPWMVESSSEPCLRTLIEKYYEPHFPDNYKDLAETYINKLTEMLKTGV